MNKEFKIAGAISAVALLATAAWAAPDMAKRHNMGDANGDGIVTKAEMASAAETAFARLDANGDGVLNDADKEARKERRAEHQAARFAMIDTDGNGELSKAEMTAHHAQMSDKRQARFAERQDEMFAMMDTDKNGSISQEEMQAMHGKRGGGRMAKNGDGEAGKGHAMRGHRGGGMRMMAKAADANNDGQIDKAEFEQFAAARFAQADTNKDDQVTSDERKAAFSAMREKWKAAKAASTSN